MEGSVYASLVSEGITGQDYTPLKLQSYIIVLGRCNPLYVLPMRRSKNPLLLTQAEAPWRNLTMKKYVRHRKAKFALNTFIYLRVNDSCVFTSDILSPLIPPAPA